MFLEPRESTPLLVFRNFNDTYEEILDDLWFDEYFVHDQLTLPELVNCLEIPTEHDFRWWYGDPTWTPTQETRRVSFLLPSWAKDSSSLHSSQPDSIEEPDSHPQNRYSSELLQTIERRATPPIPHSSATAQILYSPGLIQYINRRTTSRVPSPDSIITQIYSPQQCFPKENSDSPSQAEIVPQVPANLRVSNTPNKEETILK